MEIGKTYHGFTLIKKRPLDEIDVGGLLFEHSKTGARLCKLESSDDNKSFVITFLTPPPDNSGLTHILEHSVLNGSRKFPVKSPFAILSKGSLNTFLNAMTAADHTMYPIASQNPKDFFNLMDIYLDAVFFPKIYDEPRIFQQEGWHYRLDSATDALAYNGVVYNEMKGAFASPFRILYHLIGQSLFPDTAYGFSSGGLPEAIVDLSYESFLAFHRKYYHPSNSYILLFGDGDTQEELRFIDQNYLSQFERVAQPISIPQHRPHAKQVKARGAYPIPAGESEQDQTFLAYAAVAGQATDPALLMALDILTHVLVNSQSAPLRQVMLQHGMGHDIFGSHWTEQQSVFMMGIKNANPNDADVFGQLLRDTLQNLVERGIDKSLIEGSINRTEFALREADYGGYPTGLVHNYRALPGWLFADDPFLTLEFEPSLKQVKRALSEDTLEKIIADRLLHNPHAVYATVEPKLGLGEESLAQERAKLDQIQRCLTPVETTQLIKQTHDLQEYQTSPDDPEDVEKIPLLALSDIEPKTRWYPIAQMQQPEQHLFWSDEQTNQIIYLQLLLDASAVPEDLLPYIPLLAWLMGELDTQKRSYTELDSQINLHTGGISFGLQTYLGRDDQLYQPMFCINSKAFRSKLPQLINLQSEMLAYTRIDQTNRLQEVLAKLLSRMQTQFRTNGIDVAVTRLESYYSEYGRYQEIISGISYYQFVRDLVQRFETLAPTIQDRLQQVIKHLFCRSNAIIQATCCEEDWKRLQEQLPVLMGSLSSHSPVRQTYRFQFENRNEGLLTSSQVQYVVKGYNFRKLGYDSSGSMAVLRQVLSRDYLHDAIRVKGGAYGTWSWLGRSGLSYFASYRDPNLRKTLAAFDDMVDYLRHFSVTEQEMSRFIIGTIAREDRPLSPSMRGRRALANHLRGISQTEEQQRRDEILSTTASDIRQMADMIQSVLDQNYFCVFGNESKLQENRELFDALMPLGL